nr:MAG TPA: hypothetical protein [Caudoviricetes sp.]
MVPRPLNHLCDEVLIISPPPPVVFSVIAIVFSF